MDGQCEKVQILMSRGRERRERGGVADTILQETMEKDSLLRIPRR